MTVEDFLAQYPPHLQAICYRLRALIKQTLPEAEEIVFRGWKNISYGTGQSHIDKDLICYIAPHTNSVNLGFFRGALLPDTKALLKGTGKMLRQVKLTQPDTLTTQQLLGLLELAKKERLG